jgi:hypothetical protein
MGDKLSLPTYIVSYIANVVIGILLIPIPCLGYKDCLPDSVRLD